MYIIKNALRCIGRSRGRNILIGIIVLVIAVSACIGLSIRQAADSAKEETLSSMSVTATISYDRQSAMDNMKDAEGSGFDRGQFSKIMGNLNSLTLEDYSKYAEASTVENYYYTVTASFNGSDSLEPVSEEESSTSSESNSFGMRPGGFGNITGGVSSNSGDFTVIGYSSDSAMTDFANGTAKIESGTVFAQGTTNNECIISSELATFNSLVVGDSVILTNPNNDTETYQLIVVGVYADSGTNENFQQMTGRGFSDPANQIYMSSNALAAIISASEEMSKTVTDENTGREYETRLTDTLSFTYVFKNADDYYTFENEVRTLGLNDDYAVSSSDISAFENSLVPLETLGTMAGWFLLIILIIGAIILIVLNIFNVRERKYEIGVLTAIGMKKSKVAAQFLTEIFVITLSAVIVGVAIGSVSAVPVTNGLLKNQISSTRSQSQQLDQNFGRDNQGGFGGRGEGNMPGMPSGSSPDFGGINQPDSAFGGFVGNMFGENAENYISEIDSAMNLTVVWQMLGIAVLLTLISGAVSMLFVMRYEPLKILANRD